MESLYLILGIALATWLLTSKKFRAQIGQDATNSVEQSTGLIVDSLKIARKNQVLDYITDLKENGHTRDSVQESLEMFNMIMSDTHPVQTTAKDS